MTIDELIIELASNSDLADELLGKLDVYAREVDGYEFGLPWDKYANMREIVLQWLISLKGE